MTKYFQVTWDAKNKRIVLKATSTPTPKRITPSPTPKRITPSPTPTLKPITPSPTPTLAPVITPAPTSQSTNGMMLFVDGETIIRSSDVKAYHLEFKTLTEFYVIAELQSKAVKDNLIMSVLKPHQSIVLKTTELTPIQDAELMQLLSHQGESHLKLKRFESVKEAAAFIVALGG